MWVERRLSAGFSVMRTSQTSLCSSREADPHRQGQIQATWGNWGQQLCNYLAPTQWPEGDGGEQGGKRNGEAGPRSRVRTWLLLSHKAACERYRRNARDMKWCSTVTIKALKKLHCEIQVAMGQHFNTISQQKHWSHAKPTTSHLKFNRLIARKQGIHVETSFLLNVTLFESSVPVCSTDDSVSVWPFLSTVPTIMKMSVFG